MTSDAEKDSEGLDAGKDSDDSDTERGGDASDSSAHLAVLRACVARLPQPPKTRRDQRAVNFEALRLMRSSVADATIMIIRA
eukprot:3803685-Rhodomonas_salina.2